MGNGYYTPRLSVELSQKQLDRVRELFPHGTLKPTIVAILEDLMDLMEEHGTGTVVGLVLDKKLKVNHLSTFKGLPDAKTEQHKTKP